MCQDTAKIHHMYEYIDSSHINITCNMVTYLSIENISAMWSKSACIIEHQVLRSLINIVRGSEGTALPQQLTHLLCFKLVNQSYIH